MDLILLVLWISLVRHVLSYRVVPGENGEEGPIEAFDETGEYSFQRILLNECRSWTEEITNALFWTGEVSQNNAVLRIAKEGSFRVLYDVCEDPWGDDRRIALTAMFFSEFVSGVATLVIPTNFNDEKRSSYWHKSELPILIKRKKVHEIKAITVFSTRDPRRFYPKGYPAYLDPPVTLGERAGEHTYWSRDAPTVFRSSPIDEAYIDAHISPPSSGKLAMFTAGANGISELVARADWGSRFEATWDRWDGHKIGIYDPRVRRKFASLASGDVYVFIPHRLYVQRYPDLGFMWNEHEVEALTDNPNVKRIIGVRLYTEGGTPGRTPGDVVEERELWIKTYGFNDMDNPSWGMFKNLHTLSRTSRSSADYYS
ncbi:MAG: hypothetical protein M1837_005176 [Sclerophora amabilis]|nr:MAG: hypothetical protein M1837_005176 [Sclerophora amabilis]